MALFVYRYRIEPRKYHTHGTFVSGKDCPSVKASAAQKKKKPDA